MLRMAAADDPHEAGAPDNPALASIAALLAHRPDEANGLADPRLPAADDIALWRAVRLAQLEEGSAPAAAMFAATLPLLLAYPAEIRDRLLPLVAAETLVAGGEIATASRVARCPQGRCHARSGACHAAGDARATAPGRWQATIGWRSHATSRCMPAPPPARWNCGSLRARSTPSRPPTGWKRLLYSWRGDQRERALRERLAALKARNGDGVPHWPCCAKARRCSRTTRPQSTPN